MCQKIATNDEIFATLKKEKFYLFYCWSVTIIQLSYITNNLNVLLCVVVVVELYVLVCYCMLSFLSRSFNTLIRRFQAAIAIEPICRLFLAILRFFCRFKCSIVPAQDLLAAWYKPCSGYCMSESECKCGMLFFCIRSKFNKNQLPNDSSNVGLT